MTKTSIVVVGSLVVLGTDRPLQAQVAPPPTKGYANVTAGLQMHEHSIGSRSTFTIYEEPATITSNQSVANGLFFDVSGGYKVFRSIGVGVGVSIFNDTADATVVAQIPHPIFFNQSATTTQTSTGLERREIGVHVQVSWFFPLTDKLDAAFVVGPSFFSVTQDLVANATVQPGTQNATFTTAEESGTGPGFNGGFDFTYHVSPHIGLGGFIRYAGGNLDLPSSPDGKVGGGQAGVGLRLGF
jgi:hypothetical protein